MEQPDTEWPEVRLKELGNDACWELLAQGQRIARVAWNTATGPVVLPVNYVVHDDHVWMRTSPYSSLAREVDDAPIAFETDEIDPASHLGWSVVARGTAEVIYHHDEVPAAVRSAHAWPAGHRPLWIRVMPKELSGRRLTAA